MSGSTPDANRAGCVAACSSTPDRCPLICPTVRPPDRGELTVDRVALAAVRGDLDFIAVLEAVGLTRLLMPRYGTSTHLVDSNGAALCRKTLRGQIVWSDAVPTCRSCRRWST